MEADLYLDLSIGGTGGAGTSGDPYRSFADVPTYAGGGSNNVLVTGDTTISGSQTIKGGYNYFSRVRQSIGNLTTVCVFGWDSAAYDTTFNNLIFRGYWSDNDDVTNLITFTNCWFQNRFDHTLRFFYIHRPITFNFCRFSGGCYTSGGSNNQSRFLQPSLGNNTPYPTIIFNRCSFYIEAKGYDNSEFLTQSSYNIMTIKNCILQFINLGLMSSTPFSTGSPTVIDGLVTGGDSTQGTVVGDIGFVDPRNHNLELLDTSPVHAL